jgi:hypothetical protein
MSRVVYHLLRHKFDFRGDHHLFSFAGQFDITVTGTVSVDLVSVLIKNRCPSRVTSYAKISRYETGCLGYAWNSGTGAPALKPAAVSTFVAIMRPSEER